MTTRLVFISSLLIAITALAITPKLHAQGSSSATMQVQVTVVEGSGITQANSNDSNTYNLASLSGTSDLTTIRISSGNSKAYAITRPQFLKLTDKGGKYLEIPVKHADSVDGKGLISKISAEISESTDVAKGTYTGSYKTSVAYL